MDIIQTNRFKKAYKKLTKNQLTAINEAIYLVIANPQIGEQKVGDLSWLRVYKFKCLSQLMLLGYSVSKEQVTLTLVDIGFHENFYRDLKK
jgi:mRNA-degrading endonuclease RelE of RelBE toxin-antitoxin system